VSRRPWEQRLRDILDAAEETRRFVEGVDFDSFAANPEKLKAVLANFTIIGEAARHVPPDVQSRYPHIDWRRMRDMRNIIVHVYFGVNPRIVWSTIHDDLPRLEADLRRVLGEP
jgi:uncharacterized protein with HEPN domain